MKLTTIGCTAALLMCCLCGCKSAPSSKSLDYFPDNLLGNAERTRVAFNRAWNAGTQNSVNEIPKTYWVGRVKALNPIKIYSHRVNLVIVENESGDVEQGKYIQISDSSFLARPDKIIDGFVITVTEIDGVYNYRRNY